MIPAIDAAPDALTLECQRGETTQITATWHNEDGSHYVELVAEFAAGSHGAEVVDWLAERAGRRIPVLIDYESPALVLVGYIKERGVRVVVTRPSGPD